MLRPLLAALLILLAAALPATAQTRPGTVQGIDVVGNQRIEADTIRAFVLFRPGDAFDDDRLDRSLRTIFGSGLFRDARLARVGDRIVVTVVENPIVNRVAFEGNRAVSSDILANEAQLRSRSVFTPQQAQADRQRILDLYARRGYFGARVEPRIIELDQNRVDVVFEITDGDAARVSRVAFVGNRTFSDWRLSEVVTTRESAFWRFLSTADVFDPDRLTFDRELLRRYYLRRGFADVQITGATAELLPDRSGFVVTFTIDEGTRYRVGPIRIESRVNNLDGETLRRALRVSEGDWYDGQAVEQSAEAIGDAANLAGFPFVQVTPRISRDRDAGRIDLVFEVTDGPRAFVERIEITGNARTEDRVIRREMRLAEGDAFIAAQVRRSQQRIRDLGYFGQAEITPSPGSAPDRVNLNVRVQERPTGEISIGGGFATDAGFLADFGIRERNFLGSGVDARLAATIAQRRSQVDFSVTDPAFLDRNLAAGIDIFYVTRDLREVAAYQERRQGFALRMGYEFNERLRQSWAYTLVRRNVFDVLPGASLFIQEQRGVTTLSQIGQTLTYDARDSRLEPRDGYVIRLGTDLAGLGGDVAYFRTRVDGAYFIPLESILGDENFVLAFQASVGYLQPIGGRGDRIVDRFFLGGENLRGFRIGGAGPRDLATGDSLGGRLIWTQTTELRFPLPLPQEVGLLGRAFVDVGSLSRVPGGPTVADDASPRVGVGFGFSWRSPVGLINLDFARAVVREPYDQTQIFRFGFGTRF
ncbi:MAG: outer membrane protein assembly factor BamA [Acetobacteraceae bacterium]